MTHVTPFPVPPRVPPVEPELLASAMFLFGEYLARIEAELPPLDDEAELDDDDDVRIDTRAVLDYFAEELGTGVQTTLSLYMRVTALYRLLAASPSLARLALEEPDEGGALTEDALLAAARLDLTVVSRGDDRSADYDPREFREALRSCA
jgi:hypothetical protein